MARRVRSDCKIGTLEKRLGLEGFFKNKNGRNTRSDKKLGTVRKEFSDIFKKK